MEFRDALSFLDGHVNLEATAGRIHGLSLEAIRGLVGSMGDPQADLAAIHVTGTNGKGSVVAMAGALLTAAGLRVGTYTSPHVDTIRERIKISGELISEEEFADLVADLARYAATLDDRPSYFELLTAGAFLWFSNEAVDAAVVEVGLLGRFDATNVIESAVSVITNIGFDHTDGAGEWRRAIAGEKAGIIESGRPLVLGDTSVDLLDIFVAEGPDPLFVRGADFGVASSSPAVGGQVLDLFGPFGRHDEVYMPLHGAHQADNAAVAVTAVEAMLGTELGDDVVSEAFADLTFPGRLELVSNRPLVVLDAAHNPEAARALVETVPDVFPGARRILVLGMLGPRSPGPVVAELARLAPDLVLVFPAPSPRAVLAEELELACRKQGLEVETAPDVTEAVRRAVALADEDDLVVVTGSFYVLPGARGAVEGLARSEGGEFEA
ncbi:MAG: Dihydrofolate synthase/folylpolyglutamate synthase [Acidimicrobiaceae bacterium]|nr:Dihydrofolate synthase/folylpolyglutamate synthase [Acidimicrobiaceae bacterium]